MEARSSRRPGPGIPTVLLLALALLVQACTDNKGPAGTTYPTGQTGHADSTSQIVVNVTINPNNVEIGRRAGITVLVANLNGRQLANRHVQLGTTAGRLDRVDGFTDLDGKFVSFLLCDTDADPTITAVVEGAIGTAQVVCGEPPVTTDGTTTAVTPVVTISASDSVATEGDLANTAAFTVSRTGSTSAALTVAFSTTLNSPTATRNTDYGLTGVIGNTVTISAGSASATITLTVIEDATAEADDPSGPNADAELAIITLEAGTGYTVGSPSAAQAEVVDND